jgi:hypothetical protein
MFGALKKEAGNFKNPYPLKCTYLTRYTTKSTWAQVGQMFLKISCRYFRPMKNKYIIVDCITLMDKYYISPNPTRLSFWCENFEFFGDKFTNVLKGNF